MSPTKSRDVYVAQLDPLRRRAMLQDILINCAMLLRTAPREPVVLRCPSGAEPGVAMLGVLLRAVVSPRARHESPQHAGSLSEALSILQSHGDGIVDFLHVLTSETGKYFPRYLFAT